MIMFTPARRYLYYLSADPTKKRSPENNVCLIYTYIYVCRIYVHVWVTMRSGSTIWPSRFVFVSFASGHREGKLQQSRGTSFQRKNENDTEMQYIWNKNMAPKRGARSRLSQQRQELTAALTYLCLCQRREDETQEFLLAWFSPPTRFSEVLKPMCDRFPTGPGTPN